MFELRDPHLVRDVSLKDQALALVRQAIVTGDLAPGALYSATALAKQLGVSLSPAREAMLTLVNEGVLETVKNRGFRVVTVDDDDLREIVELRSLLEVPVVASLCHLDVDPWLEELRVLAGRIESAARDDDVHAFLEHDRDFHLMLLGIDGNDRLVEMVGRLRDQTRLYGLHVLAQKHALENTAREHFEILQAVIDKDEARARDVMQAHLDHIERDWSTGEPAGAST